METNRCGFLAMAWRTGVKVKKNNLGHFFLLPETEAKDLAHSLVKRKRVAQLISRKPGENRRKLVDSCGLLPNYGFTRPQRESKKKQKTPNMLLLQPRTLGSQ